MRGKNCISSSTRSYTPNPPPCVLTRWKQSLPPPKARSAEVPTPCPPAPGGPHPLGSVCPRLPLPSRSSFSLHLTAHFPGNERALVFPTLKMHKNPTFALTLRLSKAKAPSHLRDTADPSPRPAECTRRVCAGGQLPAALPAPPRLAEGLPPRPRLPQGALPPLVSNPGRSLDLARKVLFCH